mmetsp:Transcript_37503/g.51855  ORF Transcript_37503/g.51855 Transcript_37503/m.51855 type:complete len:99 (+) Transcript_37503:107-403(+)
MFSAASLSSGCVCPLCGEGYQPEGPRMPMVLHCGHTICGTCVDVRMPTSPDGSSLACPLCFSVSAQVAKKFCNGRHCKPTQRDDGYRRNEYEKDLCFV